MKKVYVATKARGFLLELFNSKFDNIKFYYNNEKIYETNSKVKLIFSTLAKSKLANHLGIIQRIKVDKKDNDVIFSYNRFLKTDKEYVIYLENPLALVHYSIGRNSTIIGKKKINTYLNDKNLKSIVCLSRACYETINNFYNIPNTINVKQIYPLVVSNEFTNEENINIKCNEKNIQCLYISSNFNLKGGVDIIECFNKLRGKNIDNIKLKIITQIDSIDKSVKSYINQNPNISLYDFKFNRKELSYIYNESCILLNPTRQDSFSLVVLEAMKAGNAIITTDLYAIPEMVKNDYNGYLTFPKYRFFNYDNMPNEKVWNNRKKTIYSNYLDENIVDFLLKKLIYLNNNREKLKEFCINSYKKSNSKEFNDKEIIKKWNELLSK